MKFLSFLFSLFILLVTLLPVTAADPPVRLLTDLCANTHLIYLDGYPSNLTPADLPKAIERTQYTRIRSEKPTFGWVIDDTRADIVQTAFQLLVASRPELLQKDSADLWNSGKIESNQSISVRYNGKALEPDRFYYWKVKIWNNRGEESPYSHPTWFATGHELAAWGLPESPIEKSDENPVKVIPLTSGETRVDFGKASFGTLRLQYNSPRINDTLTLRLGERTLPDGSINRKPGGTLRYREILLPVSRGMHTYRIKITPDARNTGSAAVLMPAEIGEVLPFRYLEISGAEKPLSPGGIVRETAHYPFDEYASKFSSSDTILNQVWELCKYSIKATSFAGYYVDGDRERIPYEADAVINQLSHYAVDRDFLMARRSMEYLLKHPTWPTEWHLQIPMIAWYDMLYSGDTRLIEQFYPALAQKTLEALRDENGLLSTRTGKMTPEFLQSLGMGTTSIRDIVDWPQSGLAGPENKNGGETDGYQFTDYNTVVNAFHYNALQLLSHFARLVEKPGESSRYAAMAQQTQKQMMALLFDRKTGLFIDGIGTDHSSLHANMFPLALGVLEGERFQKAAAGLGEFIRSRGMACSVYGAQFLLEALYNGNYPEYGLSLMRSSTDRSWYNMIRLGSTITLEAWDNKYKPNLDWNHAWGAAPANIIVRKLLGVEPLEPGFGKIAIRPAPGSLERAEATLPTIRGEISMAFVNKPGELFQLDLTLPANTISEVTLPLPGKKYRITLNDQPVTPVSSTAGKAVLQLGSGKWSVQVTPAE